MSRPTEPQISFADWELLQQGIELEPVLQGISDFLDDHAEMVEAVRQDLERGLKKPGTGRTGLTPSQTLRSLILMRVKSWDYRELRERIADGFTLRRFTQFYCRSVPKHDAFHRTFHQRTPLTPKERQTTRQTKKYRQLIGIAEEVVKSARKVLERTRKTHRRDLLTDRRIGELRKEIEQFCKLGDRVIDQASRRVLQGEQVPNEEKIFSIFEVHTDLIKRGKVQTPVEFGHKVFLAESAQGLITQYEILKGNPPDEQHVEASLERHKEKFGHASKLYSADRGFHSERNEKSGQREGVAVVCIPQRGGKKTEERTAYEKSPDFKKGQRFRAGIEGTISVLFRGRGMKRCLAEGSDRFEIWVGAAVLANNLMRIAGLLVRSLRKRKAA